LSGTQFLLKRAGEERQTNVQGSNAMSRRKPDSLKVNIGGKPTASEEASVDPSSVPQTSRTGPQKEVEGQYRYDDWVRCPHCSDVGWIEGLSSWHRILVRCGNPECTRLFWAPQ
jgi:hypothetical protein